MCGGEVQGWKEGSLDEMIDDSGDMADLANDTLFD